MAHYCTLPLFVGESIAHDSLISAIFFHLGHFLSIMKSKLYLEGPKAALMTSNKNETIAYTVPVPTSVEPGPYGPPKPSGTDHIIKLRSKLIVYTGLRNKPKIRQKARASSITPAEYT